MNADAPELSNADMSTEPKPPSVSLIGIRSRLSAWLSRYSAGRMETTGLFTPEGQDRIEGLRVMLNGQDNQGVVCLALAVLEAAVHHEAAGGIILFCMDGQPQRLEIPMLDRHAAAVEKAIEAIHPRKE